MLVTAVALFGVVAQFAVTKAYAIASPALIAPFEYTALIGSAALGYLVWGDIRDIYAVTGAVLIIGSGVYIIHRETIRRPWPGAPYRENSRRAGAGARDA